MTPGSGNEQSMKQPDQVEQESHRLIITRRNGSEILCSASEFRWSLPRVEILAQHRVAEQLTEKLQVEHGLRAYCLFTLSQCESRRNTTGQKYAVMEVLDNEERAPVGSCWLPMNGNGSRLVDSEEDNSAIADAIEEIQLHLNDATPGPFARPGWIKELLQWTESQVDSPGLEVTGALRQLNASPAFSLIRIETTGPAVWFKATGEPNLHELPVSLSLARLFPEYVPKILGIHPTWNGWLSEEALGTLLVDCEESPAWERAAETLAELQVSSRQNSAELLRNHCKDLRLQTVIELVGPFLARMKDLMAAQVKRPPEPLDSGSLTLLDRSLKQACELLQAFGFPDTLGHIDFNPGNIVVSASRCCFLDWAEGCVTHPLVTFEYLREHCRRKRPGDQELTERIATAYRKPWQSLFSLDILRQAMVISPLIAVFISAVADTAWRSIDPLKELSSAGYFRSLTRRMFREATELKRRRAPCRF
jgi:hypothetical protein